jgi:Transposase DDE domain
VATEVTQAASDSGQLGPMVATALAEIGAAGIGEQIGTVVADGGYWSAPAIAEVRAGGIDVLVPTANPRRTAPRTLSPRQGEQARHIDAILATPEGAALYRRRQQIVEPVFAQTKFLRRMNRFQRRGLAACRAEWKLIAATHNLLKLWRAGLVAQPA